MKKSFLLLFALLLLLPSVASADHLSGTFHSFGRNHLSIYDSSHGNRVTRFSHPGNVAFVDEDGVAVDHHSLRARHPVTVHYEGHGNHRTINRVVVHRHGRRH